MRLNPPQTGTESGPEVIRVHSLHARRCGLDSEEGTTAVKRTLLPAALREWATTPETDPDPQGVRTRGPSAIGTWEVRSA